MGCNREYFQKLGKLFVSKMRQNNFEKISSSSDVHSYRTRGGIPTEPYVLVTSSFDRMKQTLRVENIGKGMGLEGGEFGCGRALESSEV